MSNMRQKERVSSGILTQKRVWNVRVVGGATTSAGTFGFIGSVPALCHALCMSIVSGLAFFGITLTVLPLMFLTTYQLYFWLAALGFTLASVFFYRRQHPKTRRDRSILLFNAGLLLFSIPLGSLNTGVAAALQLSDYQDFFRFIGIFFAVSGTVSFLLGRRVGRTAHKTAAMQRQPDSEKGERRQHSEKEILSELLRSGRLFSFTPQSVLFGIVIGSFFLNQLLMYRMGVLATAIRPELLQSGVSSRMQLTVFDIALAKERMDKDNDGICDKCGMAVTQCIDTGQLDCTMVNDPEAIGVLGEAHIHADLAVFVDGQKLTLATPENFMKSSFLHLDNNSNKDDANAVLHQHAKNVPLWLFFRSIGMSLTKDSLTLSDGRVLKNENGKTLKFYLNGQRVDELTAYSYQQSDKLLISFGNENDEGLKKQISSVTNYAKDHQR